MSKTKQCSGCKEVLPLTAFHVSGMAKDGRNPRCRTCRSRYYKSGYGKFAPPQVDEGLLNEALESILDEIRSDREALEKAKQNGFSGGDPDIQVMYKARTETFKTLLNELFDTHKLTKKVLKNGTIERVNGNLKIRMKNLNTWKK